IILVAGTVHFCSLTTPGTFNSNSPCQRKNAADQVCFHGFFSGNKFYAGERPQQIPGYSEFVFLTPTVSTKNMQERNNVGKIGLMIAYEQHVVFRQGIKV